MQKIWLPRLTVASIIEQEGNFLIVEEQNEADQEVVYNQPAGHVEPNETLLQATIRETLEETGWLYEPSHIIGLYVHDNLDSGLTYLRVCFTGKCISYHPEKRFTDEIIAAHWLSIEEIMTKSAQHRSPMVLKCLHDYLAGKRYPLSLVNDLREL